MPRKFRKTQPKGLAKKLRHGKQCKTENELPTLFEVPDLPVLVSAITQTHCDPPLVFVSASTQTDHDPVLISVSTQTDKLFPLEMTSISTDTNPPQIILTENDHPSLMQATSDDSEGNILSYGRYSYYLRFYQMVHLSLCNLMINILGSECEGDLDGVYENHLSVYNNDGRYVWISSSKLMELLWIMV